MTSKGGLFSYNKATRTHSQPLTLNHSNESSVEVKREASLLSLSRTGSHTPPGVRSRINPFHSLSSSHSTPLKGSNDSLSSIYSRNGSPSSEIETSSVNSPCTPPCTYPLPPNFQHPLVSSRKPLNNPCKQRLCQTHDPIRRHSSLKYISSKVGNRIDGNNKQLTGSDGNVHNTSNSAIGTLTSPMGVTTQPHNSFNTVSGTLTSPMGATILPHMSDMTRHLSLTKLKDMLPIR